LCIHAKSIVIDLFLSVTGY